MYWGGKKGQSIIEAEAAVVKEGIILVKALSIPKILMEIDSETLYKTITKSNKKGDWKVQPYVANILGRRQVLKS